MMENSSLGCRERFDFSRDQSCVAEAWWTPRLGVTVWHHCVHVHGNIASSRVWVHGKDIHHSW